MTKAWLGWAPAIALSALAGCGTGPSDAFSDGGGGDEDQSEGSGGHKGDGGSFEDSGDREDTGSHDATIHDTGHVSDALLDIAFPDGFTAPDSGDSSSMSGDSGSGGCGPDSVTCSGSTAVTCKGGKETKTTCSGSTSTCADGYGCVVCDPGSGSCKGSTGTLCKSDGSGYTTNDCDSELGLTCLGGVCTGDCADIGESYIGCEYYAITMANDQLDQSVFPYYVVVANQGTSAATVTITGGALSSTDTVSVAAGAIDEIELPWVPATSLSQATTLTTGAAYHIKSTEPITAYQFDAKDYEVGGAYSYTNDASLLLPVNAMTGNYRVAAWPAWNALVIGLDEQIAGTIAIVGTQAGTSVKVTPPAGAFQAGGGLTTSGGTVTLGAGDVLQIGSVLNSTEGTYGTDPSGTLVSASAPVEVFGGSDCTFIPASTGYCDHMEEVQFPVETLGSDYLVTLPNNVNGTPQQYVKVIGTVGGTTLTLDPKTGYTPAPPATLGAGQVWYTFVEQAFHLSSSHPVTVAQYMVSEDNFTATDTAGDPAMSMAVATAQFRTSYGFTAPPNYIQNWVNVIAAAGTSVTVTDYPKNQTVTTGTAIGSSGYYVADVQVCDNNLAGCTGNHDATSSSAFGIQVYGYGSYTSVMYPGGLNLTR